jgi:hypothetical protein
MAVLMVDAVLANDRRRNRAEMIHGFCSSSGSLAILAAMRRPAYPLVYATQ